MKGPPVANSKEDFFNFDYLLSLFRYCAMAVIVSVGQDFQQKLSEHEGKFDSALNACALELCNAVRAHTFTFMLTNFIGAVGTIEDPAVKAALSKVCALFACCSIIDDPFWTGILNVQQLKLAKAATSDLLDQLRPDAIAIVDAFDIPDRVLGSAIGRQDGNVYEALFESAQKSVLNLTDPFDGYKEYLQPHLDLEFLKRGNKIPQKTSKL